MRTLNPYGLRGLAWMVLAGLASFSCCPERVTIDAALSAWRQIEPRYRQYVIDDPKLEEGTKAIRLMTCDLLTKALKEGRR